MRNLICVVALAAMTSGCALTTDTIDVPYQSTGPASPVAGASSETVVVTAVDGRTTYRDRVSSKKNGYGMEMAPIVASNDIPQTIASAIQQELTAEGYKIGPDHAQLTIEVVKFYNDFKSGFFAGDAVADVALNVKVVAPGNELIYAQYFDAGGTEPNIQMAGGDNARAALIKAFANVIHSVVNDPALQQALQKAQQAPTAGSPRPHTS
jgi:uncharacterized lipoprotein YajG